MNKKIINRKLAEGLFDRMDTERKGHLNLENMKKLYESISSDFIDQVKETLKKFVIEKQCFSIKKEEFLSLFPRKVIPSVFISLSHIQDAQRIKELSQNDLKILVSKRAELKSQNCQPKYIKKFRSSSRPALKLQKITRDKDLVFVRRAYFNSIS